MKKIFLLSILFSLSAQAALLKLKEEKLPLELVLLAKSINELKLVPADRDHVSDLAKNLNRNLKFLNKDQIYFLVKSEIYKNVLEKEFQGDFKIMKFTSLDIGNIEKNYLENRAQYSPFSRWLVESVISDFGELKNYPGFNNVKLDVPEKDPTLNLVRRKLTLLSPWLGAVASLKAGEFNQKMKRLMIKVMEDLDLSVSIYKANLTNKELDPEDMITVQNISAQKLPIKEKVEEESEESVPATTLSASEEEKSAAEKATQNIDAKAPLQEMELPANKTSPGSWTPEGEKTKKGTPIPPPAPTWTPES